MSAKEYARLMREEFYRQNKIILEVTDDLWLAIADNMEKFAEQAVEEYKGKIIKKFEELEEWNNEKYQYTPCKFGEGYGCCIDEVLEIVKSGGVTDE